MPFNHYCHQASQKKIINTKISRILHVGINACEMELFTHKKLRLCKVFQMFMRFILFL